MDQVVRQSQRNPGVLFPVASRHAGTVLFENNSCVTLYLTSFESTAVTLAGVTRRDAQLQEAVASGLKLRFRPGSKPTCRP